MKKRIILTSSIILVFITAMVCFLPWCTQFDLTFNGVEVSDSGEVWQPHKIALEGTRYEYLFRGIRYKFDNIAVASNQFDTYDYDDKTVAAYASESSAFECITVLEYDPFTNSGCKIDIYLSMDRTWCVLDIYVPKHDSHRYFVGSVDDNFDPQEILDIVGM